MTLPTPRSSLLPASLGASALLLALSSCAPADFPRLAASQQIGDVDVRSCAHLLEKPGTDPAVHVSVVFANDGSATDTRVDRGLEAVGESAASCLVDRFRALRVPPFREAPARLGRTFLMQPHDAPAPGAHFSRPAAAQTLGSPVVRACRTDGGPTGSGHLVIRFATDGTIVDAWTDQPPFAGTDVGVCVEQKFIGLRIPAFGGEAGTAGSAVKVGKSVTID